MTVTYELVGSTTQPSLSSSVNGLAFDDSGLWVYCLGTTGAPAGYLVTSDVSDPTAPTVAGSQATPVLPRSGVCTDGDYLYVSCQTDAFSNNTIQVWDISTRSTPVYVGASVSLAAASGSFEALHAPGDGYLYASVRRTFGNPGEIRIYGIGANPTAPSLVGTLGMVVSNGWAQAHGIRVVGDLLVFTNGVSTAFGGKVWTVDVTSRAAPAILDSRVLGGVTAGRFHSAHDGAVAFTNAGSTQEAIDLSASGLPSLGSMTSADALSRGNFWHAGYVVHPGEGVFDVRDPATPVLAVDGSPEGFNHDWALDWHPGRRLTATASASLTARLDIGLVTLPGGWQVGSVAF